MHAMDEMSELGVKPSQTGAFASLLAEILKGLKVKVSTKQFIGDGLQDPQTDNFQHRNCQKTEQGQENNRMNLTENVEEICGKGAVVSMYEYEEPTVSHSEPGQIRLLFPHKTKYLKHYDASGTFAFRYDSMLSHLIIMHGASPASHYSLRPGQLLPAENTDEAVRGGTYFYGSLFACPQSGQGKMTLQDAAGQIGQQLKAFLHLGIISILRVTNVIAGPRSNKEAQWSKNGSSPTCAFVVGSIVSKDQNDAFHQMIDL